MIARLTMLVLLVTGLLVPAQAADAHATGILGTRLLGYSVQHRKIVAYHLGDPHARPTMVLLGQMHGDEHAGVVVARSVLKYASRLHGVNLWVIPTMNPDGDAAHTRQNAHHVDLNPTWPCPGRPLPGQYYAGPRPLSEPEARAVRRFLLDVHPRCVASLHQPLHGVDVDASSAPAYRQFRNALAHNLTLP